MDFRHLEPPKNPQNCKINSCTIIAYGIKAFRKFLNYLQKYNFVEIFKRGSGG